MNQNGHFYKAFWKNQKLEPDAAVFSKRLYKNGDFDPRDEKKSVRQK